MTLEHQTQGVNVFNCNADVRKEHNDRLVVEDKEIWEKILKDAHGKI